MNHIQDYLEKTIVEFKSKFPTETLVIGCTSGPGPIVGTTGMIDSKFSLLKFIEKTIWQCYEIETTTTRTHV